MYRAFKRALAAAAFSLLAFAGITSAQAQTATELPITHQNTAGQQWTCGQWISAAYPENGHYYYCGDPSLPINQTSHRKGYVTALQALPPYTVTQLTNQPVDVYVFCTIKEYEIYFNHAVPLPSDVTYRGVTSFYEQTEKRVVVFQYISSSGQSCSTTTGTGAANKVAVYPNGFGMMRHEIGHYIDQNVAVPAGQYKHSVVDTSKLWRRYMQKDIDWINSTTRAGHFIPCTNIFTVPTRDKWLSTDGNIYPVCTGANGTTLNPGLSNQGVPYTTFQVMEKLFNLQYFLKRYTESNGQQTWREMVPEEFPYAVGTVGTGPSGSTNDYYINGDFFLCSKRYVEIVAKYGRVPLPSDLLSPYNRCVLP